MSVAAQVGGVAGALGLAALVVGTRRWQRLAGFGGWAAGMALLAWYLAPQGHRGLLAGAAVVGLVVAAGAAAVLVRWPWALPFLALALLPARIPVSVGDTEANLLLPLYGVVAAAALALFWELAGEGEGRVRELGLVSWPLALWLGWTGLSILWTRDLRQAAIFLLFFALPFGLLAVSLARLRFSPVNVVRLYALLAFEALLFAAIGLYQWVTRDVFWNPKVIVPNAYANFYRVNSVFYDPSVYGRFLAVAILAGVVVLLWGASRRTAAAVLATMAVTWLGLYYSYSQSSFAALMAGVLVAAALVWRGRAIAVALLTALLVGGIAFSAPQVRDLLTDRTTSAWNKATSGRASLVGNGARLALDHPGLGVGVGGFKRAYADRVGLRGREPQAAASHNTPVTVAAETGAAGLLLLLWLVGAALWAALPRAGPGFAGRASAASGIMLAAIAVHSLFYNAFFEDPLVWGLLALIAVAARAEART